MVVTVGFAVLCIIGLVWSVRYIWQQMIRPLIQGFQDGLAERRGIEVPKK